MMLRFLKTICDEMKIVFFFRQISPALQLYPGKVLFWLAGYFRNSTPIFRASDSSPFLNSSRVMRHSFPSKFIYFHLSLPVSVPEPFIMTQVNFMKQVKIIYSRLLQGIGNDRDHAVLPGCWYQNPRVYGRDRRKDAYTA